MQPTKPTARAKRTATKGRPHGVGQTPPRPNTHDSIPNPASGMGEGFWRSMPAVATIPERALSWAVRLTTTPETIQRHTQIVKGGQQ